MIVHRTVVAAILVLSQGISPAPATRIATPFQLVPLWSDEMQKHLIGVRQTACSGANAGRCQRLNTGTCDDAAFFTFDVKGPFVGFQGRFPPPKQSDSTNPQYFRLQVSPAGDPATLSYSVTTTDSLELTFDCAISGNEACPASRFQTGEVRRIEVSSPKGQRFDVTSAAKVLPDGPIVVPLDATLRKALLANPGGAFEVHAVAECFTVVPVPVEWTVPVRELPAEDAPSPGDLIARVTPGTGVEFVYRPKAGKELPFTPDWVQPDSGYWYLQDQTILDRKGDWFQLPPRPFATAVWVRLPGREELTRLETRKVYELSKKLRVRPAGASGVEIFDAEHVVIVAFRERVLEIRKEEPFDSPCADSGDPPPGWKGKTYVVNADELYDADLHLQLHPAYPRGC